MELTADSDVANFGCRLGLKLFPSEDRDRIVSPPKVSENIGASVSKELVEKFKSEHAFLTQIKSFSSLTFFHEIAEFWSMIMASNIIFSSVVKQKKYPTPVLAYKDAKKAYNQHVRDHDTAIDAENAIATSAVKFHCSIEFKKKSIFVAFMIRATYSLLILKWIFTAGYINCLTIFFVFALLIFKSSECRFSLFC